MCHIHTLCMTWNVDLYVDGGGILREFYLVSIAKTSQQSLCRKFLELNKMCFKRQPLLYKTCYISMLLFIYFIMIAHTPYLHMLSPSQFDSNESLQLAWNKYYMCIHVYIIQSLWLL